MVIFASFRLRRHLAAQGWAGAQVCGCTGTRTGSWCTCAGAIDDVGWVMDFAEMRKIVDPVVEELDHRCLNEVPGLENPTAERITKWLWERLKPRLTGMVKIELHETKKCGCVYEGE